MKAESTAQREHKSVEIKEVQALLDGGGEEAKKQPLRQTTKRDTNKCGEKGQPPKEEVERG